MLVFMSLYLISNFIIHFLISIPMLQKYQKISVNSCSLLPFIDEFVCQWLISQISIMFFLKNTSIKAYGHAHFDTGVTKCYFCVLVFL